MKRGQIYFADLRPTIGCEQGGIRPCVIIQNDIGNQYSTTVIVAMLTTQKKKDLPTHVSVSEEDYCVDINTTILLEQIRTIDKSRLQGFVGRLSDGTMRRVDEALHVSLALNKEESEVEKMAEMIHIGNSDITIKEYKGKRVVTFKDIDEVHNRPDGTARRNFNTNKQRFIEGEDYFVRNSSEAKTEFDIVAPNGLVLVTESGYLMLVKSFTDDLAWDVQRQLVNGYFRARKLAEDLSPQMKLLYGLCDQLAQAEREAKEAKQIADSAKETAQKAVDTTENIKEAVRPVFDNWREEINKKFNRIQKSTDMPFNTLRVEMYSELERRASCDLTTRLRNKKQRMSESGRTKKEINDCNRMDIIEEDKKLREIFSKIVSEYEIKYCA